MRKHHLGRVVEVFLKAYDGWTADDAHEYLEKFQGFEPESCLVAVDGDSIVGAILGYSYRRRTDLILFIQELFVNPEYRHKGVGKQLVTSLRGSFVKNPKVNVTPLVKADNAVLNFYNSLGFESDQMTSFFIDD